MSETDIPFSHTNYKSPYSPDALNYSSGGKCSELIRIRVEAVGYIKELVDWSYPDVFSPFWRLYYNSESGKAIELDGAGYPLNPDAILLVPPQVFFSCQSRNLTDHFWIHFFLPPQWRAIYEKPRYIPINENLMSLIRILHGYDYTEPKEPDLTRAYTAANSLAYLTIGELEPPETSTMPEVLDKAFQLISSLHGNISKLNEFARELGTSERNLRRLFTKHLGINPNAYILGVRIRHATQLLRDDKLSIEQIAAKTGFADRFHFSKTFQKQLELTPVQYRKSFSVLQ